MDVSAGVADAVGVGVRVGKASVGGTGVGTAATGSGVGGRGSRT
ncbi:MAG: hypothetical protein R3272_13055 [Candidatus Promineifilaceae bacterium]|nr:hypothetical protein [Candidatus Promineifilaceae bacterium]